MFSLSHHINRVPGKTGLPHHRCYTAHRILAGRAQMKERFSSGSTSTNNTRIEVIQHV